MHARQVRCVLCSLAGLTAGLSCSCGVSPCQTPACCPSGRYTWDECGCCLVCAKAEGETCGGPFRVAGTCQEGSRCLRQCGESSRPAQTDEAARDTNL